jgi:hypothetical protein
MKKILARKAIASKTGDHDINARISPSLERKIEQNRDTDSEDRALRNVTLPARPPTPFS